jgi:hypothetical protein
METKKILTIMVVALGLTVCPVKVSEAEPMGTAWTYQGRLMDDNKPMDGVYDLLFMLFNEPNGTGYQMPQTNDINDIDVIDGYFTVELDFGSSEFNGHAKWLEILVRPGDSNDVNDYVTLSPRQEVTPTPYALHTRGIFVDDGGMIGIGTTEPWYLLDVFKDVTDTWLAGFHNTGTGSMDGGVIIRAFGGDPLLVQSATENVFKAGQNGNVGIGTDSPGERLEVDYGNLLVQGNGSFDSTGEEAFVYLGDTNHYIRSEWNYGVCIGTWGIDPAMVIRERTGRVGIGTTDPQQNLTVQATRPQIALAESGGDSGVVEFHENTNQLRLQYWTDYGNTWNKDMMVLDGDTGNVGIGTNTPRASLEVTNSGSSHAIWASTSDIAVYAHRTSTGGTGPAIAGDCNSQANGASGVRGRILSTSPGSLGAGVYGYNYGTGSNGVGVRGHHDGAGAGVYGRCDHEDGRGVHGHSNNGKGVYGESDDGYGVYGYASNFNGYSVFGKHDHGHYGHLGGPYSGVYGFSTIQDGVFGQSSGVGNAVRGSAIDGHAVHGYSTNSYGIYGESHNSYAGYFNGNVYVINNVSALSFTDRTPYPKDLATAYQAVISMQRLSDGQYDENNREQQLDHSKLSDFIKSKDGNRDLSATVSCHNEVLKDLIHKQQELGKAHIYIEQLQKQNELLEARLVKLEAMIARLNGR